MGDLLEKSNVQIIELKVLIYPAYNKYIGECLGFRDFTIQQTPEEAANDITQIIGGRILVGLNQGRSLEQMFHPVREQLEKAYINSNAFPSPQYDLPHQVLNIIRGVEYRFYPANVSFI